MSALSVRPCGVDDAAAVAHVHGVSRAWYYGEPLDRIDRVGMWRELLAEPFRRTHVLVSEGGVVGVVGVVGFVSMARRPALRLELSSLYVLPVLVGSGCGSRLYRVFEAERRRNEECRLEVWAANARAIRFYAARGWVATGTTRPGPQGVEFVTYELRDAPRAPGVRTVGR